MKIDVLYDFVGPGEPLPNGIDLSNPILLDLLRKSNWRWHGPGQGDLFTKYEKEFNKPVPVFLNGIPIEQDKFKQKSLLSITTPRRDVLDDTIYLVPIGVYGSLDHSLGMSGDKSTIFNLSQKIVDLINLHANMYLFFNHTEEGEFNEEHIITLHKEIQKRGIKQEKVIFGTACYNANSVFKKYIEKTGYTSRVKLLFHNWALRSCSKHWENIKTDSEYKFYADIPHKESIVLESDIDLTKKRNHKFLSFNNKVRQHRTIFLSILKNLNIIDKNLISFDIRDNIQSQLDRVENSVLENGGDDDLVKKWQTIYSDESLVRSVDIESVKMARGHGWDRQEVYLDSYINITTETLFFEDCWYISEKIFKPIANLQPFINIGSPNTLFELRKLGFKTFSDFWDESYDSETNPIIRMKKLEKIITDLSNMSINNIHALYEKALPICIHNQNKLLEFSNHEKTDKPFIEYLSEIFPYDS